MAFLAAVLLVMLSAQYTYSVCVIRPTNIWFLLDVSETARVESTSGTVTKTPTDYDILRSAVEGFVQSTTLANAVASTSVPTRNPLIKVGLVSYSGVARVSLELTGLASLRSSDVSQNILDRNLTAGGSWTASGVEELQQSQVIDTSVVNWVIVVTAVTVNSQSRIDRAIRASQALKNQGYLVHVIHVSNSPTLAAPELTGVASSGELEVIDNYNQLSVTLSAFIQNKLCTLTDVSNPCSSCILNSGLTILPAPDTCAQFLQCLPNLSYQRQDCGSGTLFNDASRTCGYLNEYSCPAWGKCSPDQVQSYPALCCSQFYRCNRGSVSLENCPVGTVFRDNTRGCTPITAFDNSCASSVPCQIITPRAPADSCDTLGFTADPNNICVYHRRISPLFVVTQQCAPGSSWNQTLCACTSNSLCLPPTPLTKSTGPACNAEVHITFNGGVRAISDVSGQTLPMWIDSKVISALSNTAVVFDGQSGKDRNLVYIPFYSNREYPESTAFQLTFKLTNPTNGVPYDLLVNDFCGLCKKPSVYMTATANSGQVTVNFRVISKIDQEVTVSATVNTTNQPNALIRVTGIVQKLIVTGAVDVISSLTGGLLAPTQKMNTATINFGIKTVGCGLAIGQGSGNVLLGEVDDLKVYECDNPLSLIP